jgi:hypothetical protein
MRLTMIEVKEEQIMLTRNKDFITLRGKFPRLTKMDAKTRLKKSRNCCWRCEFSRRVCLPSLLERSEVVRCLKFPARAKALAWRPLWAQSTFAFAASDPKI